MTLCLLDIGNLTAVMVFDVPGYIFWDYQNWFTDKEETH